MLPCRFAQSLKLNYSLHNCTTAQLHASCVMRRQLGESNTKHHSTQIWRHPSISIEQSVGWSINALTAILSKVTFNAASRKSRDIGTAAARHITRRYRSRRQTTDSPRSVCCFSYRRTKDARPLSGGILAMDCFDGFGISSGRADCSGWHGEAPQGDKYTLRIKRQIVLDSLSVSRVNAQTWETLQ